jgi:hypothetical protein
LVCIVGVLELFGGGVGEQAVQAVVVVPVDVVGGEGLDVCEVRSSPVRNGDPVVAASFLNSPNTDSATALS